MKKSVKGTGMHVSGDTEAYLERKVLHLEKYVHDHESSALDIDVAHDASAPGKKYTATFHLSADGKTLHAKAEGDTAQEAIDIAIGELSNEASRAKGKRIHAVRRGAARIKDYFRGLRARP